MRDYISNIICQDSDVVMFLAVLHCMHTQSVCAVNYSTVNSLCLC